MSEAPDAKQTAVYECIARAAAIGYCVGKATSPTSYAEIVNMVQIITMEEATALGFILRARMAYILGVEQ